MAIPTTAGAVADSVASAGSVLSAAATAGGATSVASALGAGAPTGTSAGAALLTHWPTLAAATATATAAPVPVTATPAGATLTADAAAPVSTASLTTGQRRRRRLQQQQQGKGDQQGIGGGAGGQTDAGVQRQPQRWIWPRDEGIEPGAEQAEWREPVRGAHQGPSPQEGGGSGGAALRAGGAMQQQQRRRRRRRLETWAEAGQAYIETPPVSDDQWSWVLNTLETSEADWIVVVGNDPVWSVGEHGPTWALVDQLLPAMDSAGVVRRRVDPRMRTCRARKFRWPHQGGRLSRASRRIRCCCRRSLCELVQVLVGHCSEASAALARRRSAGNSHPRMQACRLEGRCGLEWGDAGPRGHLC